MERRTNVPEVRGIDNDFDILILRSDTFENLYGLILRSIINKYMLIGIFILQRFKLRFYLLVQLLHITFLIVARRQDTNLFHGCYD